MSILAQKNFIQNRIFEKKACVNEKDSIFEKIFYMKLSRLTALAILAAATITACKYEEGPGISLRSKRDRVANEWKITKLDSAGTDITARVSDSTGTGIYAILCIKRLGSYNLQFVKKMKDGKYETENWGFSQQRPNSEQWNRIEFDNFVKNTPEVVKRLVPGGIWNFDKRHYRIQMKPELSYQDSLVTTQKNTIDWTIWKLKEKNMILYTRDSKDVEFKMELVPLNGEPYWF